MNQSSLFSVFRSAFAKRTARDLLSVQPMTEAREIFFDVLRCARIEPVDDQRILCCLGGSVLARRRDT